MNIFYSWLGNSDLRAMQDETAQKYGPVADALLHLPERIDEVVLLSDRPSEAGEQALEKDFAYGRWLEQLAQRKGKSLRIRIKRVGRHDPTDFGWVFERMRVAVDEHERALGGRVRQRHYLVGPGTPTMAACTLFIARLDACRGKLWQSDEYHKDGVRALKLPVDLKLRDAPDPTIDITEPVPLGNNEPIVRSPSTRRAYELAERAANTSLPVLILGSTGTGKEELTRYIWRCAGYEKRGAPFVPINCGAFPENLIESELFGYKKGAFTGANADRSGLFEEAKDGLLFLDEVGELPLRAQTMLLRVLQERRVRRIGDHTEREVHCRIVAATHRDLWSMVQDGRFREDLFYRLAVGVEIRLADLRDRVEDLEAMIDLFWSQTIDNYPGLPGRILSPEARARLLQHEWPGNVRELKAALVRMAFQAEGPIVDTATAQQALGHAAHAQPLADLPSSVCGRDALSDASAEGYGGDFDWRGNLHRFGLKLAQRALDAHGGNKSRAARAMGITPQHLARLLKKQTG